ncbi:hypothetical protein DYB32_010114 [Aphanomyces invadans]|uniref:Uncharacterized protein n=1 Tax=Aphanomyces invadans TaxID=157072 RepID=A0A3R6WEI5_9STRA|nr:hypothetical protein DYB32_010114 [Aphanomyces invadans]
MSYTYCAHCTSTNQRQGGHPPRDPRTQGNPTSSGPRRKAKAPTIDLKVPEGTSLRSFRSVGMHPVSDDTLDSLDHHARAFVSNPADINQYVFTIIIRDAEPTFKHRIERGSYYRALKLRFLQAVLTTSPDPAWSSPSMAVIANAYAPWGKFADLAFADPTLPRIRRLLTSSAVPGRFQFMLNYWFDMRVGPSTPPAPSPLVHAQPLWSNQFLPVDRSSYVENTTRWHTRYTRMMAKIGITQAQHVHALMLTDAPTETLATRTQRLIQPVNDKCCSRALGPHVTPNARRLSWLATTVDALKCGPLPSPTLKPPWLVRLHNAPRLLTQMTPAEARRSRAPPRTNFQLPTRQSDVDDDFYKTPAAIASAAELRLPDAILPKYADFVYQVMLRAVKFRAHLHWLNRADQACLF